MFWTPEATQDREDIYDYIGAENPTAALALDELFAEKAGRLVDHPGLGKPGRVAGTRELVVCQAVCFRLDFHLLLIFPE
ncbi:type II toxin-antitoxin system RelE/ParE family toxin [Pseudoduganella namucuonensis]|uniref:type II toxin-antitoxin system RelE/ParE family toxin n=1 Tax=Pseudoduganella namucuonensis TaxID=1035707 RepID=UPI000AF6FA24|nr:type II toxin-antitoxin system RelE/ParE family toxin [Pseudoduganella namucuonensis]